MPDVVADLCADRPARDAGYVLTLVTELPEDSAFAASLQGGRQFRGWGTDRYLTAGLFDAVQALTYVTLRANGSKKAKAPEPYPRPSRLQRKPKTVRTLGQLVAQRKRKG